MLCLLSIILALTFAKVLLHIFSLYVYYIWSISIARIGNPNYFILMFNYIIDYWGCPTDIL